ncbi:hypothetical protein MNBD_NITROSPINAE01-988 [hydrothermal vent metagenome]|uniref:ResB-like domain-containing protein n=1 Tax=hydrothermal vent metagenome TaxID=652676 RepID=A0A3B1BUT1_9ZZZZ
MRLLIERLASLQFTLVAILLLGAGALWTAYDVIPSVWIVSVPLFLLTVNLVCASIVNPAFRASAPLFVFHLGLVAIVILAALSRLTYLKGQVEVTEGVPFNYKNVGIESGPWHNNRLDKVHFTNDGFTTEYFSDMTVGKTRNRVSYPGVDGMRKSLVIGNQNPLVIEGYRFYTTNNRGFAPLFTWIPADGREPLTGAKHLPRYPGMKDKQATSWKVPELGLDAFLMLVIEKEFLVEGKDSYFKKPEKYHLLVKIGDDTMQMRPGDRFKTEKGELVYRELRTWMGYSITGDWTMPWLVAASVIITVGATWYFVDKFNASPWMKNSG